jgi:hypothetical protein
LLSGYYPNLSPVQIKLMHEVNMRINLESIDFFYDKEDHYLKILRFLRARKFDIDAAMEMIRNDAKWRHEGGRSGLQQRTVDDYIKVNCPLSKVWSYYPTWIQGHDKQNRPVSYRKFSHFETWNLLKIASIATIIDFHIWESEQAVRIMQESSRDCGYNIETFTVVIDSTGFGFRNLTSDGFAFVRAIAGIDSDHYPERLGTLVVINAPAAVSVAWKVVSGFLDEATRVKIRIFGTDQKEWQAVLFDLIDKDQLPRAYGGKLPDLDYDDAMDGLNPRPQLERSGSERLSLDRRNSERRNSERRNSPRKSFDESDPTRQSQQLKPSHTSDDDKLKMAADAAAAYDSNNSTATSDSDEAPNANNTALISNSSSTDSQDPKPCLISSAVIMEDHFALSELTPTQGRTRLPSGNSVDVNDVNVDISTERQIWAASQDNFVVAAAGGGIIVPTSPAVLNNADIDNKSPFREPQSATNGNPYSKHGIPTINNASLPNHISLPTLMLPDSQGQQRRPSDTSSSSDSTGGNEQQVATIQSLQDSAAPGAKKKKSKRGLKYIVDLLQCNAPICDGVGDDSFDYAPLPLEPVNNMNVSGTGTPPPSQGTNGQTPPLPGGLAMPTAANSTVRIPHSLLAPLPQQTAQPRSTPLLEDANNSNNGAVASRRTPDVYDIYESTTGATQGADGGLNFGPASHSDDDDANTGTNASRLPIMLGAPAGSTTSSSSHQPVPTTSAAASAEPTVISTSTSQPAVTTSATGKQNAKPGNAGKQKGYKAPDSIQQDKNANMAKCGCSCTIS